MNRRSFLRSTVVAGAGAAFSGGFFRLAADAASFIPHTETTYGPFQQVTIDGVRIELPTGFDIRMVAKSGEPPVPGGPLWHYRCDGGGITVGTDGRWFYCSNSELEGNEYVPGVQTGGGARALQFDVHNNVVGAVTMLEGTRHNCAGGTTPWGTWLSCEENLQGQVWECDPYGRRPAVARPALGLFSHEAVAVDETNGVLYLTEDDSLGRIYRFIPAVWGDLSAGRLQAAHFDVEPPREVPDPVTDEYRNAVRNYGARVTWVDISPTMGAGYQPAAALTTLIPKNEGCDYDPVTNTLFVTDKNDDRVWAIHLDRETAGDTATACIIYDAAAADPDGARGGAESVLTGCDNLVVAPGSGDLYVSEDKGVPELVLLESVGDDERRVAPFLRFLDNVGELAGPAFHPASDPAGNGRLVVSTYGGTDHVDFEEVAPDNAVEVGDATLLRPGRTWLITGPFRTSPNRDEQTPTPDKPGRGRGRGRPPE